MRELTQAEYSTLHSWSSRVDPLLDPAFALDDAALISGALDRVNEITTHELDRAASLMPLHWLPNRNPYKKEPPKPKKLVQQESTASHAKYQQQQAEATAAAERAAEDVNSTLFQALNKKFESEAKIVLSRGCMSYRGGKVNHGRTEERKAELKRLIVHHPNKNNKGEAVIDWRLTLQFMELKVKQFQREDVSYVG